MQIFLYTTILSITLPLFTSAEPHGPSHRRHSALANRKRTSSELQTFHRRDFNARATFYDVGLGACGKTNVASDFIVALNSCEYGGGSPGPQCFKMITIKYQGKQTQAQIMDECPGCPCGGLDMSRGLFTFFAPESAGVISVDWSYDDGGSPPAPSSSPNPTPTSTWVPPPPTSSSVWVDPSPWTSQTSTSTWSAPSSSSSSWVSSSSRSSSSWSSSSSSSSNSSIWTSQSSTASSTSSSSSSTPTITPTPTAAANFPQINKVFASLGTLVVQYGS